MIVLKCKCFYLYNYAQGTLYVYPNFFSVEQVETSEKYDEYWPGDHYGQNIQFDTITLCGVVMHVPSLPDDPEQLLKIILVNSMRLAPNFNYPFQPGILLGGICPPSQKYSCP